MQCSLQVLSGLCISDKFFWKLFEDKVELIDSILSVRSVIIIGPCNFISSEQILKSLLRFRPHYALATLSVCGNNHSVLLLKTRLYNAACGLMLRMCSQRGNKFRQMRVLSRQVRSQWSAATITTTRRKTCVCVSCCQWWQQWRSAVASLTVCALTFCATKEVSRRSGRCKRQCCCCRHCECCDKRWLRQRWQQRLSPGKVDIWCSLCFCVARKRRFSCLFCCCCCCALKSLCDFCCAAWCLLWIFVVIAAVRLLIW